MPQLKCVFSIDYHTVSRSLTLVPYLYLSALVQAFKIILFLSESLCNHNKKINQTRINKTKQTPVVFLHTIKGEFSGSVLLHSLFSPSNTPFMSS